MVIDTTDIKNKALATSFYALKADLDRLLLSFKQEHDKQLEEALSSFNSQFDVAKADFRAIECNVIEAHGRNIGLPWVSSNLGIHHGLYALAQKKFDLICQNLENGLRQTKLNLAQNYSTSVARAKAQYLNKIERLVTDFINCDS